MEVLACRGNVKLAQMQFEAATLKAQVLAEGVAETDTYESVVDAGNAWFESIDRDDYELTVPRPSR